MFRKYHYLNTEINTSAHTFIGCINGVPVCHTGFIYNPLAKGLRRVHRLVVLPDYQGVGIGVKFITACAKLMDGSCIQLMTTTPALVHALCRSDDWWLKDYGRRKASYSGLPKGDIARSLRASNSSGRITYSFFLKK